MACTMQTLVIVAVFGFMMLGGTYGMGKREINSKAPNANKEEFQPVTGTRKFSYQVSDNIKGADQNRQETWDNGTVTGSYVSPHRDGKFLRTEYVADKNGFRIVKTEELSREEAMNGANQQAGSDQAKINIASDQMEPISYSVTKEQLEKGQKKEKVEAKAQ